MFRTRENTKTISRMFITLLLLWQVGAYHHLLVTSHTISYETSPPASPPVRAAVAELSHLSSGEKNTQNDTSPGHPDECEFLTSITLARTFIAAIVDSYSSVRKEAVLPAPSPVQHLIFSRAVIDYAPSTSPPVAA